MRALKVRLAKFGLELAWIFHLDEQHRKKAAFERPSLLPERMGSRLM